MTRGDEAQEAAISRSWVEVNLAAVEHNVRLLRGQAGGGGFCAVVKANGYGHGSVEVAKVALAAGASCLGIAHVEEAVTLRASKISAPIWLLSEPIGEEFTQIVELQIQPSVYSVAALTKLQLRAEEDDVTVLVHLKVDTGMHRVGAAPSDVVELAGRIAASPNLELAAVWTHLATSETAGHRFAADQLDCFDDILAELDAAGVDVPATHVANTGAILAQPRTHGKLVRSGIGIYGLSPGAQLGADLQPALSWHSTVSLVKRLPAGSAVSYGQLGGVDKDSTVATIPVGYADGYRRSAWACGGCVLIGGKRRPILGVVTMDQLVVDCGNDKIAVGEPVVLVGSQGSEEISVAEIAAQLGTIDYEVVCAIGPRVERRYT